MDIQITGEQGETFMDVLNTMITRESHSAEQ